MHMLWLNCTYLIHFVHVTSLRICYCLKLKVIAVFSCVYRGEFSLKTWCNGVFLYWFPECLNQYVLLSLLLCYVTIYAIQMDFLSSL